MADESLKAYSVTALKKMIKHIEVSDFDWWIKQLGSDSRKSVNQLGISLQKQKDKHQQLEQKLDKMLTYEKEAYSRGYSCVVGIDEAGRGPLVGPVVAGVVLLDLSKDWLGIDDSKKLSEEKREYFYQKIKDEAIAYAVGVATHEEIDAINILNATKLAMKRAIEALSEQITPDFLLIDAVRLADIPIEQENLIKGDSRSASIAAASIMAKVTRDHMLYELDQKYPQYHFANHKGYGTKAHYEAIEKYGILPEHRRSFLKNYL